MPLFVHLKYVPLTPFVENGGQNPTPNIRIAHAESLDYGVITRELDNNVLARVPGLGDGDFQREVVVNVFSPYTGEDGLHVMTINIGRQYCPSPAFIEPAYGESLREVWHRIGRFISGLGHDTLSFGYNWSPISFGYPEESLGGGQSLPTRVHFMQFGESAPSYQEVGFADLSPEQQRLLGANNYGAPMGRLIAERLKPVEQSEFFQRFFYGPHVDTMGVYYPAKNHGILPVIGHPGFFRDLVRPMDVIISGVMQELTETLTDLSFSEMYAILRKTERGICTAVEQEEDPRKLTRRDVLRLRATPRLRHRTKRDAEAEFASRGLPVEVLDALWAPVVARCSIRANAVADGTMLSAWRKGFAYAWILYEEGGESRLRVAPFPYLGACGIVEATQVLLKRVTDKLDPDALQEHMRKVSGVGGAVCGE